MGLICEYFAAPSDEEAAAVVHRLGGPGDASGQVRPEKRRSLFHRRARTVDEPVTPAVAYPTVDGVGVEPVVQMGELEAVLTGRPPDDAVQGGDVIASVDDGACLVVRLTSTLTDALAAAEGTDLLDVATRWSATEEFWGEGDPVLLADLIAGLARLARDARADGAELYCWVSV